MTDFFSEFEFNSNLYPVCLFNLIISFQSLITDNINSISKQQENSNPARARERGGGEKIGAKEMPLEEKYEKLLDKYLLIRATSLAFTSS